MTDALMRDAKRLHKTGRIAEAAELYRLVLSQSPKHGEALYGLGMAHAQTGRLLDAEGLLAQALAVSPGFAEGWRARAMMLMHLERIDEAHAAVDRALAIRPDFKEALALREQLRGMKTVDAAGWNDRGAMLAGMKRMEEALECFDRALALAPDDVEALCNRATLLFETGRLQEALAGFDTALARAPGLAPAWNNRGNVLARLGRYEDALASYDRALAIQPDFAEAAENRELPLFELGRIVRSPAKYMRGLFDGFSGHYDDTMLGKLGYRGHLHVRAMADAVLPGIATPLRILDLGCGTGLVGEAFRDILARGAQIDGIDISEKMIDAARKRGLYETLTVGDLETVLAEPGPRYNLILSADTMTYFGDLARVFAGVERRLEAGGFYLFASEAKEGESWEKTKVHRFRHSESYIRAEAARAGLSCANVANVVLRQEENAPVKGFAVTLKKPHTPAAG